MAAYRERARLRPFISSLYLWVRLTKSIALQRTRADMLPMLKMPVCLNLRLCFSTPPQHVLLSSMGLHNGFNFVEYVRLLGLANYSHLAAF